MCESSSIFGLSSREGCCSNVWAVSGPESTIVYLLRISAFTCATRSRVPVLAMFKIRVGHVFYWEKQDLLQTCPEYHVLNLFFGFAFRGSPSPASCLTDLGGGRRAPEPICCQASSKKRLKILSQNGCVQNCSGSAPTLHKIS